MKTFNVLSLRDRIRHRLSQNAKAFGSDEKFFGTKEETAIIEGLYNGDIPDDGSEADNDASSLAYEIWMRAKAENPQRAARVERMSDLVFATRPARGSEDNSVGVFVRTERGLDGFGVKNGGDYNLITSYEALKFFECTPDTPGLRTLDEHFSSVQGLVHGPLQQPTIISGQLTGIRKRVYQRLKNNLQDMPLEVATALEALYATPLTAEAESRLSKALKARSNEDLGTLISALYSDGRLVIQEGPGIDPIRIVCSMGVSNG